jgi:membrane protein
MKMLTFRELLSTPTAQVGKAGRFAIFQIKLWSHCARLLKKNNAERQAAALSYHTIFGIVPLAIIMLLIFQSFPTYSSIGDKIKGLVYKQLQLSSIEITPDEEEPGKKVKLTEYIDELIGKFFTGVNKGSITIFSVVIVLWAALALLSTIEKTFNNIWHVAKGRNFLQRTINYWALLTLGPLLLSLGIYANTEYATLARLQQTILSHVAPTLLSYIVAVAAFFFLYFILPNTKVQAKAAIWGAAVAALVWIIAKGIFGYCVTELKLYSTIYGAMALIPITVFWINVTWLTVLFGLQLTFTTQHLKSLDAAEIAASRKTDEYFIANDLTAINIARQIAAAFEMDRAPVTPEVICSKLDIPPEFGEKILNHLVHRNIIVRTSDPAVGFMPAKDPANIRLSDIAEALAAASFAQSISEQPESLQHITQSQRSTLAQYNLKQILTDESNMKNG